MKGTNNFKAAHFWVLSVAILKLCSNKPRLVGSLAYALQKRHPRGPLVVPSAILLRGLSGAFADAQRGHRGGLLRGRGALHRTVIDIPYVQIYGLLLGRSRSHQIEGHPPPFCERVVKRGEAAQRGWMTRWIVCDTSRGGLLPAGLQGQLEAFMGDPVGRSRVFV